MSLLDRIPGLPTDSGEGPAQSDLTAEEIFHVLASTRRQYIIAILDDVGMCDKSTMAEALAGAEEGHDYDADDRKRCYVAIHQAHVPKLVECGVIEEAENARGYSQGPNFEAVNEVMHCGLDRADQGEKMFSPLRD